MRLDLTMLKVRRVQGLAEWYRDLDRQNLTEEVIDAMVITQWLVNYEIKISTEGRENQNTCNYKSFKK